MLNVNNDTLSVTSGVNTASGTSGITQSETGLSLDLQLVKSMNSSAGWTESSPLPTPPAGHSLVTPLLLRMSLVNCLVVLVVRLQVALRRQSHSAQAIPISLR